MYQKHCRYFSGYKPCSKNQVCGPDCASRDLIETSLLIIHLGALGSVLRSTSLLPALRRQYPKSKLTWVTSVQAKPLLMHNPFIDSVIGNSFEEMLKLRALEFDVVFVIDKEAAAAGIAATVTHKQILGFTVDPKTSSVVPASREADYLWEVGLDNHLKFFINQKTETQMVAESLRLKYRRDDYQLFLTPGEGLESQIRKENWLKKASVLIGFNTGCSPAIPYKKLTISAHRSLILKLKALVDCEIVLLGGEEDQKRNAEIAVGLDVIVSPTDRGLRDGITSMNACDLVVSGDSLGMHMAIALKKWVVAWFGPTCAHEIDLFDRGTKVVSKASCGPCWKRQCHRETMCYDLVSQEEIIRACLDGISKLPSKKSWDRVRECAY